MLWAGGRSPTMSLLSLLSRGLLFGTLLGGLGGCSDDGRNPAAGDGGAAPRPSLAGECLPPTKGCPCGKEGAVQKCGVTVAKKGDTLTCRSGERTCSDGAWSDCLGDKLTQVYSAPPSAPGVRTQNLSTGAVSCMDECDPYCQLLADTPDGAEVDDDDFVADPIGLTLTSNGINSGNCPEVVATPENTTLEVTAINLTDGTVTTNPSPLEFSAICQLGGLPIEPTWQVDQPDRALVGEDGTFQLFTAIGGDINVSGNSLVDADQVVVSVKVNVNIVDPDVTTPGDFDVAGTQNDPGATLYPYRNTTRPVVFPLDLSPPLVQWKTGGTNADAVKVALRYPRNATAPTFWYSHIYKNDPAQGTLQTTGAPAWQIPEKVWTALGRTSKSLGATLGRDAEIVIQRRSAGVLYRELTIPIRFSSEALRGTAYYVQYERRLYDPVGTQVVQAGQADLDYVNFNPLAPEGTICPVGNGTHSSRLGGSTTRAIDMSKPTATNFNPLGDGIGGCPVCHSVSRDGSTYVSGSRFLQRWPNQTGTGRGFVNSIGLSTTGTPQFTVLGEAPNYSDLSTSDNVWGSRGFSFAALTPNGGFALQGPGWWGNTSTGANNLTVNSVQAVGGQIRPMFLVPTVGVGANVEFATTAPLTATRTGNVLSGAGALPSIDGSALAVGNSLLVKDQADQRDNGIYTVTEIGANGASLCSGTNLTTSTTLTVTYASEEAAGYAGGEAFDNDATSRWSSGFSDPQWVQVDLGAAQTIGCIKIDWENASAKKYDIQVSNDQTTYTTVASLTNMATGGRSDQIAVNATARYVRIMGLERNTGYGYSIYEMDVYGSSGMGGGTPFKLTRRADADNDPGVWPTTDAGSILGNWEVRVTRGAQNHAKVFRLSSAATPDVNVTPMEFVDTGADELPVMSMPVIAPADDAANPNRIKIAYVNGNQDVIGEDTTAWRKGLTMIGFDTTTRKIVPNSKKRIVNNYNAGLPVAQQDGGIPIKWPFFEHDNRSVVFVETSQDEYCRSTSQNNYATDADKACYTDGYGFANAAPTQRGYWPGRLWSVDSEAPAPTKVELATLNSAQDTRDAGKVFQPTVLPFVSGGYRWVMFTSPRSYGNQLNQLGPTGSTHFTCAASLLWVAALDDVTSDAADRSYPAFLLPGQNMEPIATEYHHINERGYLVPSPCKAAGLSCTNSDECCGTNECRVDTISASGQPSKVCKDPNSCRMEGGACLTDDDCCGGSPCIAQQCQNVPAYAEATYARTFEAKCEPGTKPLWGLFSFHLTTVSTSHISFSAQTAPTMAELTAAQVVPLKDSSADNYGMDPDDVDVGDALLDANPPVSPALSFLRVSMNFHPSTNGAVAPTLHDWEQRFSCVPAE